MSTKHKKMTIDTVLNDEEKLVVRYMANEGNVSYDEQLAEIFRENIEHYVELYLGQAQNWQKETELIMSAEEPDEDNYEALSNGERWGKELEKAEKVWSDTTPDPNKEIENDEELDLTKQNQSRGL